ncbi:MAG: hypothetical protein R3272_13330 [Candidatus Promineifilaceae bacterium]|nr:hypothetical protein [Candidatus Promineifilaceae bacterium]
MKKHPLTRILFIFICTAALTLALGACAAEPEETIVGVWSGVDEAGNTGTIEFQADGTVIIDETLAGDYEIVDEEQIQLEGPAGVISFDYELDGDTLVLANETGSMTFERVEEE